MKTFEEILSYHTGYSIEQLKEKNTELLLKPYDVLLANKEWTQQVKNLNIPAVSNSVCGSYAPCTAKDTKGNCKNTLYKCSKLKQTDC